MIGLEELNEIKERKRLNSYYAEKEYLQYILLHALSRYPSNLVFRGGTCLRICFGLERASEDLDFNANLSIRKIKEIVEKCLRDFWLFGISYTLTSEKEFKGNLRMEMRFQGPLYNGNLRSTNTIKIDFNKGKVRNKIVQVIPKLFSDVPLFSMVVMDEKEILAEKIRALASRKEPRDLYDLWAILSTGIQVDKKLVEDKFKEERIAFSRLSRLRFPSKEEYENGLKNLVYILPEHQQVIGEVSGKLAGLKDLKR